MKSVIKSFKMAKQAATWRDSASLIILSKDGKQFKDNFDYKILLFSRSEKASFMPTTSVFPGGVCEPVDESPLWLKYFQTAGIQEEQLNKLILKRNPNVQPQPDIFQTKEGDQLHRDISLRITAIRETFEEVGILICRARESLLDCYSEFGSYYEDFDRKYWQQLVHNDASQFLNLCEKLNVVPDLWSLNEWSVWLTPATFKKRFETAFYLITLPNLPHVILEQNEGTDYKWLSPKDALNAHINGDILLGPPQAFELSRLLNLNELSEVQKFAYRRALNSTILMFPIPFLCIDGMVILYPGDSNYPSEPNTKTESISTNMTMEQFRNNVEKLHRFEFEKPNLGIFHMNFKSIDGHLKPANLTSHAKL